MVDKRLGVRNQLVSEDGLVWLSVTKEEGTSNSASKDPTGLGADHACLSLDRFTQAQNADCELAGSGPAVTAHGQEQANMILLPFPPCQRPVAPHGC